MGAAVSERRKAIVIGATSGIGWALAGELVRQGYLVGATGRRGERLAALREELGEACVIQPMDVRETTASAAAFEALVAEMGGVDLLILNAGVGNHNPELAWEPELATLQVNVIGFAHLASLGYRYFATHGGGHLVGVSSIAGLRGSRTAPAYAASKAFDSNYLEGLRARAHHDGLPITVTDIQPGYIATPMTAENRHMFWVATPEVAARQIVAALHRRARVAHITRRWVLIAWLVRHLPGWVVDRV